MVILGDSYGKRCVAMSASPAWFDASGSRRNLRQDLTDKSDDRTGCRSTSSMLQARSSEKSIRQLPSGAAKTC